MLNSLLRRKCSHFFVVAFIILSSCTTATKEVELVKPNIIVFYVDDLGYGDLSCYGASQITTQNVDELAENGMRLTDGHSSAATCTPSRYSLLTGEYAFRNNAAILPGDAPLLIGTDKPTLPKMLSKAGYRSAVIGKWHLGLGNGNIDWNGKVSPGPLEIGFDYSFLLPSTGDRVPAVYLENHTVLNLTEGDSLRVSYKSKIGDRPTGKENPELLKYKADGQHSNTIINGVSRIGFMEGGKSAEWVDEEFPDQFIQKAEQFIGSADDQPFFLFFSFHDIHVPRMPMEQFQGKSGMGPRGDAILQMDWTVGQVMNMLKKRGIDKNTLVVFTSDNGPVLNDGYEDEAVTKLGRHDPRGGFSGGKYSALEAGTRVPTIFHWPDVLNASVSNALFTQLDLFASLASILNIELAAEEAIDSEDLSSLILGKSQTGRTTMLEESETLSLRKGNWKYIRPWLKDKKYPSWIEKTKNIPDGLSEVPQLYDLELDKAEQKNVAQYNPDLVREMEELIESIETRKSRLDLK